MHTRNMKCNKIYEENIIFNEYVLPCLHPAMRICLACKFKSKSYQQPGKMESNRGRRTDNTNTGSTEQDYFRPITP